MPVLREEMATLRCLSIRAPWSSLIFERGRNVDNRSWATDYRGAIAIHVPRAIDLDACAEFQIDPSRVLTGCIIGTVELVDCVAGHVASAWADPDAPFHWILEQPRLFAKPVSARGSLGLFSVTIPARLLLPRSS